MPAPFHFGSSCLFATMALDLFAEWNGVRCDLLAPIILILGEIHLSWPHAIGGGGDRVAVE